MQMFSNCSGPCEECVAHFTGGCLAGHEDDEFLQMTLEKGQKILDNKNVHENTRRKILDKYPELNGE